MRSSPIRPTTMLGIKSYAGDLKKLLGIDHTTALQRAAQAAGFQNLAHARSVLPAVKKKTSTPRHTTIITCHWKSRETKDSGTEGLAIELRKKLGDMVTIEQMKRHPLLCGFFVYDKMQLVANELRSSQHSARHTITQVARVLQFMAATGLRPSGSHSRIYPGNTSKNRIPGADHTRAWFDPATRAFLMTDEPYYEAIKLRMPERVEWAHKHGYQVLKANWLGMYAPDVGSRLYLVGRDTQGLDLGKLLESIDGLPESFRTDNWAGVSLKIPGLVIQEDLLNVPVKADCL